jgi:hypothetical protein
MLERISTARLKVMGASLTIKIQFIKAKAIL